MVRYPSLRAGKIQFAEPDEFVNNLQGFKVNTRPTRTHWVNGRPPVQLSIPALESQLYLTGNQEDTRTLLQYSGNDKVKLMVDCDNYSCSDLPAAEAFAKVKEVVLVPLLAFITAKTGKVVSLDELCVQSACRKQKPVNNVPRWKQSFHVYFPSICITANRIEHLLDHLQIPSEYADRAPWKGEQQHRDGDRT